MEGHKMKTKSLLTLLPFLFCISISINLNAQEKFQRIYGGFSNESFRTLYPTNDGGYILGGSSYSFGGSDDIYLVRTKNNGDTLWTKTYGGNNWERAYSIVETNDGGFAMTGEADSYGSGFTDMYIMRVDSNGNMLWTKILGEWGIYTTNVRWRFYCGRRHWKLWTRGRRCLSCKDRC